jgi:catechol 2,3-dioxygenase-like lactoylglutathione lyase family enzyme
LANAEVDQIFIAILASPDRQAALDFYANVIGFERGDTYTIIYSLINSAFGLAADTKSDMSMTKVGRLPGVEIDQYPAQTTVRPQAKEELPPGVGMISFLVQNLDAIKAPFIAPAQRQAGFLYEGRRSATLIGPAGEYIELIETRA